MRNSKMLLSLFVCLSLIASSALTAPLMASSATSHATHFFSNKGPGLQHDASGCYVCHADGNQQCQASPVFSDGQPLNDTTVCDVCHSSGGAFDGAAMAKANWDSGVYKTDGLSFQAGKEAWCATCHDNAPAHSRYQVFDVSPVVVDNLQGSYTGSWKTGSNPGYYGTNYHYHAAGSGTDTFTWTPTISTPGTYEVYARWVADSVQAPDATFTIYHDNGNTEVARNQTAQGSQWVSLGVYTVDGVEDRVELVQSPNGQVCADAIRWVYLATYAPNIVGDNDTYGFYVSGHGHDIDVNCLSCHDAGHGHIDNVHRTYSSSLDNYQAAYRLKSVDGGEPLNIPRSARDPLVYWQDFALCFGCHNRNEVVGENEYDTSHTNFWDNDGSPHNDHFFHLRGSSFDSDWNGSMDSGTSCVTCHNVHGSPSQTMVRHGELISTPGTTDKMPALNFMYLTPDPDPEATVEESVGARFAWNGNELSQNGVCRGCHGFSISWYRYPYLAPHISDPVADPEIVSIPGASGRVVITCRLDDFNGSGGYAVTIDLTTLNGGSAQPMYDDGDPAHCDDTAGDGTYSICMEIPAEAGSGSRTLVITAQDADGHSTTEVTLDVVIPGEIVWDNGGSDNNWSTPENWSTNTVPEADDRVAFNTTSDSDCTVDTIVNNLASISLNYGYNGTVALNADCVSGSNALTVSGDIIVNSGTLLCKGDTTVINEASGGDVVTPHGQGLVINAANIAVGENGHISADSAGFPQGEGPEPGSTGHESAGGAGHGGSGGQGVNSPGGSTYGSVSEPTALGSGGVISISGHSGGPGGGAIKLNVNNTLTIKGTVSANGGGGTQYGSGGAGGSIWLIAGTLAGSGSITADGGSSATTNKSGGGGGGRVALEWTERTFDGVIRAQRGSGYRYGKNGTIWVRSTKWTELWNSNYHVNGDIAIVVDSSDTSLPTQYTFDDLIIDSGVTLECQADPAAINEASGGVEGNPHGSGVTINATSITVEGTLSADGLGFPEGEGPGTGYTGHESAGGAGHGGSGAYGVSSPGGSTYGSVSQPTALGSGGVISIGGHAGGPGGGAIKLDVNNTLTINGTVSANGGGSTQYGSGGAGGSIWLIAGTLAGSGSITADGGSSVTANKSGGGGGGRIALQWTERAFDGAISAEGGSGYGYGNHGTIWVPSDKWDDLWNETYHVNGSVALAPNTHPDVPATYQFVDLYIESGATLECQGDLTDINTASGGVEGNPHGSGVTINANNITIEENAAISANSLGFIYNNRGPAQTGYSGGGYGGRGGPGLDAVWAAPIYGSPSEPSALGSAGRHYGCAGSGGGAVKLDVADTLTIDGAVTANGQDGSGCCDNGGGAGGSIWIITDTLAGSGALTADGGNGNGKGGAGGGGRIAVYFTDNVSIVQEAVSVFGGNSNYESGEEGTVVWSPVGGYAEANVLPQAQVVPSPDGTVTVTFKATDIGDTINSVYSGTETVVIVNDSDAVFVDGANTWVLSTSEGYAGDIHYAEKDPGGAFPASCTWTPTIPEAGNYKVFARWTSHPNRATDAPYTINYDGNSETIEVNQEINGSRWNYLGTYTFAAGESGTIVLTNDANEYVMADAVKLVADFDNNNTDVYNLCCFEYSVDGGANFNPPDKGDDSGCLSAGWEDNSGTDYTAGATFDDATAYSFTWDSRHGDLLGLDADQNDVQIRFKARNVVTQDATVFNVDSRKYMTSESFWLDNRIPDGYTVKFDQEQLDSFNHIAASFTFSSADVGATYSYSIDDDTNGGTDPVTGTGTVATPADQVTGLDVSELDDGTLTLTVFLTDAFGNVGPEVNATVDKSTAYSIHFDQSAVNAANETAVSFTFSGADVGKAYTYSIDDTNGATSPVTGGGTTTSSEDQVTGINVIGLDDGTLTLIVSLAGSSNVADAVLKDTESPSGYTVSIDQEHVFSGNETAVSFTFSGAQVGSAYSYSMDDTNGGTSSVTGTGIVLTTNDQITGINVSGLDDDTLTLTVSLTDPSGNVGPGAVDTVLKDTLPPSGYSVTIDQAYIYSGNQGGMSFTFSSAEVGATYSYSIDDTNGTTDAVTGTGVIGSPAHQVTGANVSGLDDDILTLTVSLTDVSGNGGSDALDTVIKDTQSPTGMDALWMASVASNSATVKWNEASDEHWTLGGAGHYEIWFGKNLADVQGRTGTASEWDESDDSGLASASTVTTTLTGLDLASHTYYFKIWAVDDFGNEAATLYATADAVADSRVWDNDSGDGRWSNPLNWSGDALPLISDHVVFNSTSDTPCLADTVVDHLGSMTLDTGYSQTVTFNTDFVHGSYTLTIDGDLVVNSGKILCLGDQSVINVASGGTELVPHGRGIVINAANVTVGADGRISADYQGFPTTEGPGGATWGGGGYGGRGGPGNNGVIGLTYGSLSQPTALGSGGRHYSVGGSGGGALKLVVTGTVTVDGTISANGEDSTQCCDNGGGSGGSVWVIANTLAGSGFITADGGKGAAKGGSGGGGRIALDWNTRTFNGVIRAQGAVHPWGEEYSGAHGTIWVPSDKWGELWNSTYHVNGTIALAPNSHPDVPATYQFEELHINSGVTLECQGDLADVNEASGGEEGNPHGSGVIIEATTIIIEEGAAFSANELGFVYNNQGPGTTPWGGAGHGGRGGPGNNGVIGLPYGSLKEPSALGSSGRHYSRAGSGGGAIKLLVDDLTVNGTLSANGQNTTGCCDNGGGSGGSLWVIVNNTLTGSGAITADGGTGAAKGGSGAGGRIALQWPDDGRTFDGVISAKGATHSWGEEYSGSNGTIWVPEDKWDELWDDTHPVNGSVALAPNSHPDVPDKYLFGELRIASGVTLECQGDLTEENTASGGDVDNPHGSGVIIQATSIFIEADAALSANAQGFIYNDQGPGTTAWGGAGHGGRGGAGNNGVIGLPYGSLNEPTALGSSGRHYSRAGSGGGAIKLLVDDLTVNGTLSANGQNTTGCCDNGGGSGGSLWVIVNNAWTGSGAITADGGTGAAKGGSGAGGRIALQWPDDGRAFDGVISAKGATHSWGEEYYGNHGTIWVPEGKWNELWNATHRVNGSVALAPGEYDIDELYIESGAVLECQSDLEDTSEGSGVTINANNITIEEDAAISANRLGFIYNNRGPAQTGYSGGGHGGRGGPGLDGAWGGPIYGSVSEPSALGSAGRQGSRAGSGGGAVKLNVADTLTIDGAVTADGQDSTGCCDNGGGGGGSIWINTDALAGSGAMSADGGNGSGKGGAGGGGRIAAYFSSDTSSIEGTTSVVGGTSNYEDGEDGTIVWSPIGGYTAENVIPADRCAVADGVVTITFKVKGPRKEINGVFVGEEVIINDSDSEAAFSDGTQPWTYSTSNGYAGDQHYAVTDAGGPILSTCTWTPDIPSAGNYKVYAWWTDYSNRATDAPYTINYDGNSETVEVNQELNGSRWNYLGTYPFADGISGTVVLTNDANEYVMADAVRFLANFPTDQYTIHTFEYSVDGGPFKPPDHGDGSGCLSSGWQDNDGAYYEAGLTFTDAPECSFTWNTLHDDMSGDFDDVLKDNVQIRFKVRNTATQNETIYHIDSKSFVTSASFEVDNTGGSPAPMGSGGDADGDGMPDDWESMYGINDPGTDPDVDGLNNLGEYENSTDPTLPDTDSDGISDGWEVDHGFNPLVIDAARIWDNESGDGLWSNPINWSGNALPATGDIVVFNASLSDDCTGDVVTNHVGHVVLDFGYTGTLTIEQNAVDSGDTLTVSGDITVNRGTIVCEGDPTAIGDGTEQSPHGEGITIEASNITVASGAEISVDGQGFEENAGPGAGSSWSENNVGAGGGHGGYGGDGFNCNGGVPYGSEWEPTALGSGGAAYGAGGGNGGGAIKLVVSNTLKVDGVVSANGNDYYQPRAGGGAGGSIWILCDMLQGAGIISADGGDGSIEDGGGGSGGRIRISTTTGSYLYTGTMSVMGGTGQNSGDNGTVHAE